MRNDSLGVLASWRFVVFVLIFALTHSAWAKEAAPAADDPVLERRVMDLAAELRCLVCQNETLADSNAPLAVDLRAQIRDQMREGRSERDIIDFMVARYGDFVLFRPPFKLTTVLLWFGPLLLLVAGFTALFYRLARRRAAAEVELSEADHARAARLLDAGRESEKK